MITDRARFLESLTSEHPPEGLDAPETALWYALKSDWATAHDLINDLDDPMAMRLHAYLHRVEPDLSNARYWYRRCGLDMPSVNPAEELDQILSVFVHQHSKPIR